MTDRRSYSEMSTRVRLYVHALLALAFFTLASVVAVTYILPAPTQVIAVIIGITSPMIAGLLGAAVRDLSQGIDGRMSALLEATAEKERVKGVVQGLVANPHSTVVAEDFQSTADSRELTAPTKKEDA